MAYWEAGGPRDKRFDQSAPGGKIPMTPTEATGAKPGSKTAGKKPSGPRVPDVSKAFARKL